MLLRQDAGSSGDADVCQRMARQGVTSSSEWMDGIEESDAFAAVKTCDGDVEDGGSGLLLPAGWVDHRKGKIWESESVIGGGG